jgi:hypothetical protein
MLAERRRAGRARAPRRPPAGARPGACYRGSPLAPRRSTAIAIALALLWLALGWANVARGAAHSGPGYRFWAFQHHCYSDVIALHGDRYLGGGRPLPYLEDRIEYPVLLGLALWLASFAPGGALGHFTATYLFLSACLLAALIALARIPGAAPWWLGATPALVYYAGLNWDLLPSACRRSSSPRRSCPPRRPLSRCDPRAAPSSASPPGSSRRSSP